MHIAIDITPLSTGHSGRGVGSYTKNLVEALQKYNKEHSYSLFTRGQKIPDKVDIVHYPYFDPFFLTLPLVKHKPVVVTVHDLIPLVFTDKFPSGLRGAIKWQIQKVSLLGAKRILADSDASKNDIIKITGIKKEIIDTIYLAADPVYHPVTDKRLLDSVEKKYALPKNYVLYVGDVNWNKNIPGLIHAWRKIWKDKKLVLVGKAFTNTKLTETRKINRLIESLGLSTSVIRTGHVSETELAALYCRAACTVLPSFYEGFGLPVLEAMACESPVVCTNTSSLKEIAGPAICVSQDDLVEGLMRALTMDKKIQIARQLEWVKHFTWKKTVRETIQSYEKVLETL